LDAANDGIANPVIRYVVPDKSVLAQSVREFLEGIDEDIFVEMPLTPPIVLGV